DETSGRQGRQEVNLRVGTGEQQRKKQAVGFTLEVQNLFDSRKRVNFQSPFSGTRFQQGRRVLLTLNGKF
ncbi:MAG: hypothetical protein H7Z41_04505, partial [Cytophagales bacterium]|nr:hypothetical protein [Armatimonadota bacterium]